MRQCMAGHRPTAWIALALTFMGVGLYIALHRSSVATKQATHAAMSADTAVADFARSEAAQRARDAASLIERKAQNAANLAQIRKTATINHRQALALGRISLARAGDNARALAAEKHLSVDNRRLILSIAAQQARIGALVASVASLQAQLKAQTAQSTHRLCVRVARVYRQIYDSVASSLATVGKPGTPGADYYALFPAQLQAEKAQLQIELKRFTPSVCA
jgi:hypothetical protein